MVAAVLLASRQTFAQDPNATIKSDYHCTYEGVLCIDSCSGNILAKYDGPTATFLGIDQGKSIQVSVVGLCELDATVQYTVDVTYRSSLDSLTKTSAPGAPVGGAVSNPERPAVPPGALQFSKTIQLNGQSTDHIAEVTAHRAPAAAGGTLSAPKVSAGAPIVVVSNWTTAYADYVLRHGRYYIDFGAGLAVVVKGIQSIAAIPYRGNPTDLRLATETSTANNPIFSGFIYPGGHSRDSLSPFQRGGWGWDLLVVQVGTELSRDNFLRSVYLGVGAEPVSGLNVVVGGALVPVTVYRAGAQSGLAVPSASDLSNMTRSVPVVRFYVALSASTEIFNAVKTAYTSLVTP